MSVSRAAILLRYWAVGAAALVATLLAVTGPAAARPAADCQPFAGKPCLFPFPSNLFTRSDRSSQTGLRVHLPASAMPRNVKGAQIAVGPYDRNDGFSPGSALVLHVAGLDNPAALRRTNPVGLTDMAKSFAKQTPIVVIDEATGKRQLIWVELDAQARGAANTDLL